MECPVCNAKASLLDVVDFNKCCEEVHGKFLPLSGKPVYYWICENCQFVFCPEIMSWSAGEFQRHIYNDQYLDVDPGYVTDRPTGNHQTLLKTFQPVGEPIRHLDYGGGNGALAEKLRSSGWDSTSYDPFPGPAAPIESLGQFNLITAFEVFEHVPDVNALMSNIKALMAPRCVVLFTTMTTDDYITANTRLSWWYASPRNGHISLYSRKSLAILAARHGLLSATFGEAHHCFLNEIPDFASHLIYRAPAAG